MQKTNASDATDRGLESRAVFLNIPQTIMHIEKELLLASQL